MFATPLIKIVATMLVIPMVDGIPIPMEMLIQIIQYVKETREVVSKR